MKTILNHPGYMITKDGQVWSKKLQRFLTTQYESNSHGAGARIRFFENNRVKAYLVGELVLETFVKSRPVGHLVIHKDGDFANNQLKNLKWGTRKDITNYQRDHNTLPYGEMHGRAVLTESDVKEIRQLYKHGGIIYKQLGAMYGVDRTTIGCIVRRKTWRHLGRN